MIKTVNRFARSGCRHLHNNSYISTLELLHPNKVLPIFGLLDKDGSLISDKYQIFSKDFALKAYKTMIQLSIMDKILYESQRQGRISFYMTNTGEEACQIGSASAIDNKDLIYAQYRETGVLMWRGFTLDQFMNQCYSNCLDMGKGKQMPVHYGCKDLNFVTISSPVGTQIPQAAGSAYAYKRAKNGQCVVCYFGEGTASQGDAFVGLNFAITLKCPVIFICRNNGYAISTPTKDQYGGDGIAARSLGMGIPSIRVDGNDLYAMYYATQEARLYCLKHFKPVLIEAITYRLGHHSTSDDSSMYRSKEEIEYWQNNYDPIMRFKKHLLHNGWWSESEENLLNQEVKTEVLKAFNKAEAQKKPPIEEMFTDVYDIETPNQLKQKKELFKHLKEYGKLYSLDHYA